jgi:tetratricopeptide (TPR) repeat protein
MDTKTILNDFYTWVKDEPLTAGAIGNAIFWIIAFSFKLPQRLFRWIWKRRKKPITEKFPFRRIKPDDLGQWLMEKGDRVRLTCCENPYVPKEPDIIYESKDIESERRRMYIGTAETGKTRSAYEWIMEKIGTGTNAEILIPMYESLPNPISEEEIPILEETVVLFYDDMHNCLLPAGKEHQKEDSRILSPIDRFEELINLLQKRCTKLYIVCTARWERNEAVKSVENLSGIWKTFNIITLKDAERKTETDMITKLAKHLNVKLTNSIVKGMADINQGRSYENTVTFLHGWDKQKTVTNANLDDYKKGASERWRENVFFELVKQNKLVAQIIGTLYTLRFELGLPLYRRFILICAEIKTDGLFKKHRLKDAMRIMCRHEFHPEGEIISCPDYQLEIEGLISPSAQDCIDRLYNQKKKLSTDERNSLADWYFSRASDFYYSSEFMFSASEFEKVVSLKPDKHEAYNNWGLALYGLAKLKGDESLYEQSIQKYQKAVEIKPGKHEAYNNWGNALYELAKLNKDESLYEQAIQKFQKAMEIKPDYDMAYYNWGITLCYLAELKGDESLYEQSFQKYQKAVEHGLECYCQ